MENLVCPDCGNSQFTQRRYISADVTVEAFPYGEEDITTEILDSGERDAPLVCIDCGFESDLNSDLIPESEYEYGN